MGGKIEYRDEILMPQEEIFIEFSGKNPFLAMAITPSLLKETYKLAATGLYFDDIRWDVTGGENKSFYAVYRTKRTEDKWTKFFTRVVIQGTKDKENFG